MFSDTSMLFIDRNIYTYLFTLVRCSDKKHMAFPTYGISCQSDALFSQPSNTIDCYGDSCGSWNTPWTLTISSTPSILHFNTKLIRGEKGGERSHALIQILFSCVCVHV